MKSIDFSQIVNYNKKQEVIKMKNLKREREKKGYTQKEFAKLCGIGNSTYNQYETGRRQPDLDTMILISNTLNVSIDELIGKNEKQGIKINVLGSVAAGIPISAIQDIIDEEEISEELAATGDFFGLIIKGDSMSPMITNGDTVIVRSQPDAENGDIAIVLVNGDEATCKKIKKTPEGVMLIPLNSEYEPIFYTNKQIEQLPVRIIGKVVEQRRKF